jgi:hypothetical protein
MNEKELLRLEYACATFPDPYTVVLKSEEDDTLKCQFTFDRVFGINSEQKEVYEQAAKPLVKSVIEGFNGTIFAYG